MALGDFTVTQNLLSLTGAHTAVSGTAEVSGTKTAFALIPTGYIVPGSFKIYGKDNAGSVEVDANEDASGTATNGTVALQSTTVDVSSYSWSCEFI
jgi:hypothetical protein|tara:strand:- start:1098 stop:1385 length:288 start_codon:yes stop_codon:yes gene_type:complete